MTRKEMLLTLLAEECTEVGQRASKAIRFGLDEIQEGQQLTNAERIVYEFNDLYAIIYMLFDEGLIPETINTKMADLKEEKVCKYLEYSKSLGTLTD